MDYTLDIKIHEFAVSDKMLQYCRYVYQIMYCLYINIFLSTKYLVLHILFMCILIHSSQAWSKYTLYIDEVKAAKAQDIQKRKVTDAEEADVQAKKKLQTPEDEANSEG